MEQWRAWSCSSRQIKAFLSLCRCLWARDKAEEQSQPRERRASAACCHRSSRLLFNLQASDHRLHSRTGHSRATYVTGLPRPIQGTAPKTRRHRHAHALSSTVSSLYRINWINPAMLVWRSHAFLSPETPCPLAVFLPCTSRWFEWTWRRADLCRRAAWRSGVPSSGHRVPSALNISWKILPFLSWLCVWNSVLTKLAENLRPLPPLPCPRGPDPAPNPDAFF